MNSSQSLGLVVCMPGPHGGTSLAQWDPRMRDLGDDSLYGATLARIASVGGKIAGILWYQGESDAVAQDAERFGERALGLTRAFRADLRQPDLPFYFVQIGCVVGDGRQGWDWSAPGWNRVREAQRQLARELPNAAMVTAIDLR